MPKTSQNDLKLLNDFQHLDSTEWDAIRYLETQKLYNCTPGYTDIDLNEEVKAYESPRHLIHADRAFAALTMCAIKQRESLQTILRELLSLAKESNSLSYDCLEGKINELFSAGDFLKNSSDLLQLICGHRAEIIQMRRDCVTKQVKDPLLKTSLKKIPPTATNLFNAEKFAAVIEKAGGVRKCFWPLKKASISSTSQAEHNKPSTSSQGVASRKKPTQGCSHGPCSGAHYAHATNCHNPPPQGGYSSHYPSQGYNHHSVAPNNQNSFRGRSYRTNTRGQGQNKAGQKRTSSQSQPQHNQDSKRKKF